MNIKIGEKIKDLRKKTGFTQEKLAEYLGITPQAISRWESASVYPDIETIPAIANFFGVSTDELFGVDKIKNQEKIDKIYEELRENKPKGLYGKNVRILRKAVQEFPNNHGLLGELAFALSNKEENRDEAIAIWERIAEDSPDGETPYGIWLHLAYAYSGFSKEKAIETARKLPDVSCTSTIVLSRILEGEERFKQIKSNITSLSDWLYMEYDMLARKKYNGVPEKQIMLFNKAIAIFDILCEDKDYGFYNGRLSGLYFNMCNAYLESGDIENALGCLNKAADHAIDFDAPEAFETNKPFEHTSIVFEREPSDTGEMNFSGTANFNGSYEMLEDLKNAKFNALKKDARFKEITAKLKKYAKKYEI